MGGGTEIKALVLPPNSLPKVRMEGDPLEIKIINYADWLTWLEFPDGYRRALQAADVVDLIAKLDSQLKGRYNITSYTIKGIPASLSAGEIITIGDITYA